MQKKKTINGWKKATIVLAILSIFLICYNYESERNKDYSNPESFCEFIQVVPSWVLFLDDTNSKGIIIKTGVIEKSEIGLVDSLIKDKVYFYYSSSCPSCQLQIKSFGTDWERYVDAELTIDCYNNE